MPKFVRFVARDFGLKDIEVCPVFENDYLGAIFRAYVEYGEIVIVEQDIKMTESQKDLILHSNPNKISVLPYKLHPSHTLLPEPVFAHRVWEYHNYNNREFRWLKENEQFCDLFGLGAAHIPSKIFFTAVKHLVGRAGNSNWKMLDNNLSSICRFELGYRTRVLWDAGIVEHLEVRTG